VAALSPDDGHGERMNRLALLRERLNRAADADRYAVAIRKGLLAADGRAHSRPAQHR
jgi:hypothetical protein